jgi:hypothetical protein
MADEALTPEKRFAAAAQAGRNCFLTGMAGTGQAAASGGTARAEERGVCGMCEGGGV